MFIQIIFFIIRGYSILDFIRKLNKDKKKINYL